MKSQESAYAVETDNVGKDEWTNIIQNFDDASIYQTWSWGAIRWGEKNLSHLVLKKDGEIVAAAQSWLVTIPVVGAGIAYVKWGPMWQVTGRQRNPGIFQSMIRALRLEYVTKRGLLLRVLLNDICGRTESTHLTMEAEGFVQRQSASPERTLVMDLSYSTDELRRSLNRDWRCNLSRAEKNGLEVVKGVDEDLFERFVLLFSEMVARKRFGVFLDPNDVRAVQDDLPGNLKMLIMICQSEGEPIAGIVVSGIGKSARVLLRATARQGLRLGAANLLQWRMLEWLKERGILNYDLGGVDPGTNPGTYHFKAGLCGKLGKDIVLGEFEECQRPINLLAVRAGERLRSTYRRLKKIPAKC
jgi:hypothetical protein